VVFPVKRDDAGSGIVLEDHELRKTLGAKKTAAGCIGSANGTSALQKRFQPSFDSARDAGLNTNAIQELLLLHSNSCSRIADRMLEQPKRIRRNLPNHGAAVAQHVQDVVDELPDVLLGSAYAKAEIPVIGEEKEDGRKHNVALS
jgi:hypothetical protein